MHVARVYGSVLLLRRCNKLYTSRFVDDAMFARMARTDNGKGECTK